MAERSGGASGLLIGLGILGVAGLGLLLAFAAQGARDRQLDASPIGFGALTGTLKAAGIAARASHPYQSPLVEDLGLRILPLYDLDLHRTSDTPRDRADRIAATSLRDIDEETLATKLSEIPTLIMLPKWSGAMVELGVAHRQSLLARSSLRRVLRQIGVSRVEVQQAGAAFLPATMPEGQEMALFHAQTFERATLPNSCTEIIGMTAGALVVSCQMTGGEGPVLLLSDPDLLNNHGLAVAENAAFAPRLVAELIPADRPQTVYVDFSPDLLTAVDRDDERQDYTRGSAEFARFLTYPFGLFWAALLIVLGVVFWRGQRRFGPVAGVGAGPSSGPSSGDTGITRDRSKRLSLGAKARLLRLSGADARLAADFVQADLQDLAQTFFGREASAGSTERVLALLTRRDPALARDFAETSRRLTGDAALGPAALMRALDQYQSLRKKVLDHHGSA
ncbi:hypothetical protein [Phaeovulum sp. W22_SRMD_FR3]|uniref:hypothetical protein n=1 Tax=Phaeovulum sp. W22_SRMD_FR3 TaxID=3240274 RepID=UPI003F9E768E